MSEVWEIKKDLLFKEQRVSYWEKFGVVPSVNDLDSFNVVGVEL